MLSGLYYKHMMIVYDASSIVIKWSSRLIDTARGVIYDRHMFIVQATDLSKSLLPVTVTAWSQMWTPHKKRKVPTVDLDIVEGVAVKVGLEGYGDGHVAGRQRERLGLPEKL